MSRAIQKLAVPALRGLCRQSILRQNLTPFSTTDVAREYATTSASVPSAVPSPAEYSPASKPPSARPVETRKSQLIRTYTSLLRTSPLILFFQHSNLTAVEWAAVRRELKKAVNAVPPINTGHDATPLDLALNVQLQVLRTNMFNVALKIVEFYNPEAAAASSTTARTAKGPIVHDLSEAAYRAVHKTEVPAESTYAQIEPLMVGPLAALVIPAVSPAHLAAALSVLSPVSGMFAAPTRKKNPGYHDPICQNGLSKLLLVGGRIEGKVFDQSGVNWVGGIQGGLDGLRAQLVRILQGAGLGVTWSLEAGSKNLWLALEGRKDQLKDE